jgi:FtsP/CotA-like multicopper oxidase with cupredoxin domain
LWADFSAYAPGKELLLKSLPFSVGGGGGMMGGAGAPYGAALDVLRVRIGQSAGPALKLPERLSEPGFYRPEDAQGQPRPFVLAMQHMAGKINGRSYVMDEVAPDEIVKLNSLEIWEFENAGGGMGMMGAMMVQPHPMHMHAVQFQLIERKTGSGAMGDYETLKAGFVDEGWKDTLLVLPGEKARVLVRFSDYAGQYLYHCHNLEHEDGGMMRNFRIEEV